MARNLQENRLMKSFSNIHNFPVPTDPGYINFLNRSIKVVFLKYKNYLFVWLFLRYWEDSTLVLRGLVKPASGFKAQLKSIIKVRSFFCGFLFYGIYYEFWIRPVKTWIKMYWILLKKMAKVITYFLAFLFWQNRW